MGKFLVTILLCFGLIAVNARTIVVGRGLPVHSLKKAIDIANSGDTVSINAGVYKEGAITLTKSIVIIGQGKVILDGEHKYQILLISTQHCTVKGLTFQNAGYSALNDYAAIKLVDCSNITLEANTILNAYFAIHISNSSAVVVRGNIIAGNPSTEQLTGNGIHLWKSSHALIENNQVSGHRDGISFEFVTSSLIRNNNSWKNIRYGLHFMFSNDDTYLANRFYDNGAGVAVMYSKNVRMLNNQFDQNWGPSAYGILLKDITDSQIIGNIFYKNTVALHLEGSSRINIDKNSFRQNGWAVKVQASCDDNNFHRNNFTGNSFDISTNGTMVLNRFDNNFWDRYEGYDLNRDGTGDVPYHPISMYSMIVEQNPATLMLFRSFTVSLLDKAEKAIPGLTPEDLIDRSPSMKMLKL